MASKTKGKEGGVERPPIVAVLGHVDHGKTSLLDQIRKTRLTEREAGGITQSIGAYQAVFKDKEITFIDTPGHAAFSQMRARGGQAADLVVLVVAADDGVMPQTIESLEHIKTAEVPFLVALTKIDLPGANIDRVKQQLAQNEIPIEDYGGDVVVVPVSSKTGQGIDDLLEMIILLSQIHEIKADPQGLLEAVVIESRKSKAGPSGTIIVRNGTLKIGDQVLAGNVSAKVKSLMDEAGKRVNQAEPGQPVEVLGFDAPPPVGARVIRVDSVSPKHAEALTKTAEQIKLPKEAEDKLKIILKADSIGSLEALSANLSNEVFLVSAGVGDIFESDVLSAQISKAKIFGFKVKVAPGIAKLAENEKVEIKIYEIIYKFLEDLETEALRLSQPEFKEDILGKAEIKAEFAMEGQRIAGCQVTEGKINKFFSLHLTRGTQNLGDVKIVSMRKRMKEINEAKLKEEFGAVIDPQLDFKPGDMLISFKPKTNE